MLTRSDLFLKKNKIDQLFCNINFNDFFAFHYLSFSGNSSSLSMMVKLSCSTKKIHYGQEELFIKSAFTDRDERHRLRALGLEHGDPHPGRGVVADVVGLNGEVGHRGLTDVTLFRIYKFKIKSVIFLVFSYGYTTPPSMTFKMWSNSPTSPSVTLWRDLQIN